MTELILRPMVITDADKMLTWKNYEETRQFAIASHDEIKREDHIKWLTDNYQHFKIIQHPDTGNAVGAIRIQNLEISIWIDREYRNQGIAKKALKLISGVGMAARIVEGNIASMRAFIFAGFIPVSYQNNYYIFLKQ